MSKARSRRAGAAKPLLFAAVAAAHAAAILFLPPGGRAAPQAPAETASAVVIRLVDIAPLEPPASAAGTAVETEAAAVAQRIAAATAPAAARAETAQPEARPEPAAMPNAGAAPPEAPAAPVEAAAGADAAGAAPREAPAAPVEAAAGERPGAASGAAGSPWDGFLPAHRVTDPPRFDGREIAAALVFPPAALRASVEGRVVLELFVDSEGAVRLARVLSEHPEGRGFGEAAERAFAGRRGTPAMADGKPVAARFRYPVSFRIR